MSRLDRVLKTCMVPILIDSSQSHRLCSWQFPYGKGSFKTNDCVRHRATMTSIE